MAGNLENILRQGDCIPEEMMLRYIEGKLSARENHLVEKHLLECEMCADALEGLRMMQPADSKKIISDLNRQIDERLETQSAKIIPFNNYYRIAAVLTLFLLFGGGYLLIKNMNEEKMLAQNASSEQVRKDSVSPQLAPQLNTDQKAAEPIPVQPQFSLREKNAEQKSQPILTESKDLEMAKADEASRDDAAKPSNDNSFLGSEVNKAEMKETINQGTTSRDVTISDNQSSAGGAPQAASENVLEKKAKSNKEDPASYARQEAKTEFKNLQSVFDKAKADYDLKKYSEAAVDFEMLMNDTTTKFYDDAKWFLANSYMRIHKNAKARKLLKEIENSDSTHKKEAHGLLQELQ